MARRGGNSSFLAQVITASLAVGAVTYAVTPQRRPQVGASVFNVQERGEPDRSVYYARCADARAAGAAPIYRGQPGYRPELDRDNDGVACEPYRGR